MALKNNYDTYKSEFQSQTGLKANVNIAEYIAYYNARSNDKSMQALFVISQTLGTIGQKLDYVEDHTSDTKSLLEKLNKLIEQDLKRR